MIMYGAKQSEQELRCPSGRISWLSAVESDADRIDLCCSIVFRMPG